MVRTWRRRGQTEHRQASHPRWGRAGRLDSRRTLRCRPTGGAYGCAVLRARRVCPRFSCATSGSPASVRIADSHTFPRSRDLAQMRFDYEYDAAIDRTVTGQVTAITPQAIPWRTLGTSSKRVLANLY